MRSKRCRRLLGLARDELLTRQLSPAADFVYETFVHDADAPKLRAAIVNELRGEWTSAEGGRPSSQQVNAELRNLGGWQGHDEKGSIWWGIALRRWLPAPADDPDDPGDTPPPNRN